MTINENVIKDLNELKKIGVEIPQKAFDMAKNDDLSEYDNMSVTETTDLIISLASMH